MQCQTVKVTSSPGYQRHDKCSKEYLPVYLGEEPVYLDTSKLVTRKPILDLLDCDEVFPPIFETTNGQLVQAAPTVQPISLQLSKLEQLGYHIDELEHVEETDSLLYTVLDWKSYIWDALDTCGHYASCLVILYLIGKLIYTLVSVVATCRKGTSWATALRLNIFLLTEFWNNLIQTLNETERGVAAAPTHGIELEELN